MRSKREQRVEVWALESSSLEFKSLLSYKIPLPLGELVNLFKMLVTWNSYLMHRSHKTIVWNKWDSLWKCFCLMLITVLFVLFWDRVSCNWAILKLMMKQRMTLSFWSSCLWSSCLFPKCMSIPGLCCAKDWTQSFAVLGKHSTDWVTPLALLSLFSVCLSVSLCPSLMLGIKPRTLCILYRQALYRLESRLRKLTIILNKVLISTRYGLSI